MVLLSIFLMYGRLPLAMDVPFANVPPPCNIAQYIEVHILTTGYSEKRACFSLHHGLASSLDIHMFIYIR